MASSSAKAQSGANQSGANPSLKQLRAEMDRLSSELLRLLPERARVALEIGHVKRAAGDEILQPARERSLIEQIVAENPGPLSADHLRRIFTEVISACRALEHELRVAYMGPEHTFSHEAALRYFGGSATFISESSIAAVFQSLETDRADVGVVPIENSTEGSVTLTLDLLIDTSLQIIGELMLPIRHALMSLSGDADDVRRIVSHQQSLAQCRGYLTAHYPNCPQEAVTSNTLAAKRAAEDSACAAIGPSHAAEPYGLKIIAQGIQDFAQNTTRFLVIGKHPAKPTGSDKTSALFAVADRVGALNQALAIFARNSINMSKLESRPLRSRPWEYLFFVDLKGHREDAQLKRALAALQRKALFLKILGSYPEGRSADR